jgi:Zn-dependent protease with chaperone function
VTSLAATETARCRPATVAAARVSRAGLALGALGLAAALLTIARLVETWRVGPHGPTHEVTVFGARLAYPAANADAIAIVALAVMALSAIVLAAAGAVRELVASGRLNRALQQRCREQPDGVLLLDDEHPLAFCAGLLRPRVYLSTGARALLDDAALRAVLEHERHHARRRDPLRLATGRVLASSLFFLPGLAALAREQVALSELGADESAIGGVPDGRSALARAILGFDGAATRDRPAGFDPARIDHLLGESASWRFPALLCLAAGAAIALLVAVALLLGMAAHGSATLAPPLVSRQPCVVVLALIPAALAGVAAAVRRRRKLTR